MSSSNGGTNTGRGRGHASYRSDSQTEDQERSEQPSISTRRRGTPRTPLHSRLGPSADGMEHQAAAASLPAAVRRESLGHRTQSQIATSMSQSGVPEAFANFIQGTRQLSLEPTLASAPHDMATPHHIAHDQPMVDQEPLTTSKDSTINTARFQDPCVACHRMKSKKCTHLWPCAPCNDLGRVCMYKEVEERRKKPHKSKCISCSQRKYWCSKDVVCEACAGKRQCDYDPIDQPKLAPSTQPCKNCRQKGEKCTGHQECWRCFVEETACEYESIKERDKFIWKDEHRGGKFLGEQYYSTCDRCRSKNKQNHCGALVGCINCHEAGVACTYTPRDKLQYPDAVITSANLQNSPWQNREDHCDGVQAASGPGIQGPDIECTQPPTASIVLPGGGELYLPERPPGWISRPHDFRFFSDWLVAPDSKHIPPSHHIQSLPAEKRAMAFGFDLRNEDWVLKQLPGPGEPKGAIGKNSFGHWAYLPILPRESQTGTGVAGGAASQITTSSRAGDVQRDPAKVRTPLPSSRPAQGGRGAGSGGRGAGSASKRLPSDDENKAKGGNSKRGKRS